MSFFLTPDEIAQIGFAFVGIDVLIDRDTRIINAQTIRIGSHVRIDAFAILSAGPEGIQLGNHVHIGAGTHIFGGGGAVIFEDFSGASGRVSIYTLSDDFTRGHLTNPTVPETLRMVQKGPVTLRRHSLVGAGSVVLPGVELRFGSAVGALTLVRKSVEECAVVSGNPARQLRQKRSRALLEQLEGALR